MVKLKPNSRQPALTTYKVPLSPAKGSMPISATAPTNCRFGNMIRCKYRSCIRVPRVGLGKWAWRLLRIESAITIYAATMLYSGLEAKLIMWMPRTLSLGTAFSRLKDLTPYPTASSGCEGATRPVYSILEQCPTSA